MDLSRGLGDVYKRQLKRSGLTVVFNSDAHFASKVNDGRMEAMRQYALAE